MEIIYVKLKNEDLDVWRPVQASVAKNGIYFIELPPINLIPENEEWEFFPGMFVIAEEKESDGNLIKVATSQVC